MTFSVRLMDAVRVVAACAWESPTNSIFLGLGAALIIIAVQSCWIYARLRHFPGPQLAGWSRLPLISWTISPRAHLEYQRINECYGPLARIAPNVLLTSDVNLMRRMAAARSKYQRNDWYMAFRFNPERDSITSLRDAEAHAQLKMKLAPGYSGKEIIGLEEKINANIMALLKLIESKYLSGPGETKAFDLAQKVQYFTMDTICDISFGKPLGFLANDADMYDYLKTVAEGFPFLIVLSLFPWLMHVLSLNAVKKYLPSAKDSFGMGRIMGIAQATAEKRFPPKEGEVHQDMLGSFIRHGLTREEAEAESVTLVLAGAETTATALRMIIFYVVTNPRVLAKLRAEIARAGAPSPISDAQAKALPYLQAVIKEGLRICPPITGIMFRDVPPEGDAYNGMFLPGGTIIGSSVMGVFMNKKIWGDDAESFRPERFFEGTEDELREREAVADTAFGYGRWRCLGRNIALMELNKAVTEIVRNFELSIVNPTNPFKNYNAGVQVQWDMWMRASRVDHN